MTTPVGGEPRDPATLDLYKLAIEMADRISARRGVANSFYVTLQSAILATLGFLTREDNPANKWILVGMCAAGVITSVTWFLLLRSYRDLNTAKFKVILAIEKDLPHRVFGDEWLELKKDKVSRWKGRYAELGTVERVVPVVFAAVNIVLAIYLWSL